MELKIDKEFQNLIPPLTKEEYKQLEENLKEEGCRDSLIIWNNIIIDGHNRHEICTKNTISFSTKEMDFENRQEAIEWIIKNQFGRRNLSAYERAKLVLRLKPIIEEKARANQGNRSDLTSVRNLTKVNEQKEGIKQNTVRQKSNKVFEQVDTKKELAKIAGVSHDTIHKVEVIEKEATEEQKKALSKGEKKINTVYGELRPQKPKESNTVESIEIEQVKNSEIKKCNICGKEKPLTEFYSNHTHCKECECSRKKVGLSAEKIRELNKKFPDEELNKMYEEMKSPHPIGKDTGESIYNPVITNLEELLNDFSIKINNFLFAETHLENAKTIKPLIQKNINDLEKIINFIKE